MTDSPKPLKVLHIGKYFPPYAGGMETFLRDLMAAQARQGFVPQALVHQSDLSLISGEEFYETNQRKLSITRAAVWARLIFTPISPTFPWLLHRIIKRDKPDLLHVHMPNVSAFWALLIPSARRLPLIIHWHSDVLASKHSLGLRFFYYLYEHFQRRLLEHSSSIIATSPAYLESSAPLIEFRSKCKVVPLGLDPAHMVSSHVQLERHEPDKLRVLAIGRLTYYKGFEYLIRAIAELDNVELHIVGTGDLEKHLIKLAKKLHAGAKVTFLGKLSDRDLADRYQACDCLCLPSIERTEAFGVVLLEAMSHGKATVVSNVEGSGMGWVVEDGITGLLFPPQNTDALASSLQILCNNRNLLSLYGKNGRNRFENLFHIEKSAIAISHIYRERP